MAVIEVPSDQRIILNQVDELSEVTKTTYRGRHFAFAVSDDNFHAIVESSTERGLMSATTTVSAREDDRSS